MLGTHRTPLQPWKAFCLQAASPALPCSRPPQAAVGGHCLCSKPNLESERKVEGLKLENQALGDRGEGGEKSKLGRVEEEAQMLPTWAGSLA